MRMGYPLTPIRPLSGESLWPGGVAWCWMVRRRPSRLCAQASRSARLVRLHPANYWVFFGDAEGEAAGLAPAKRKAADGPLTSDHTGGDAPGGKKKTIGPPL